MVHREFNMNDAEENNTANISPPWQFADKWDCKGIVQLIKLAVRTGLDGNRAYSAWDAILLAAQMDDAEMAALAIRSKGSEDPMSGFQLVRGPKPGNRRETVLGQGYTFAMNPSGLSWIDFQAVPMSTYGRGVRRCTTSGDLVRCTRQRER